MRLGFHKLNQLLSHLLSKHLTPAYLYSQHWNVLHNNLVKRSQNSCHFLFSLYTQFTQFLVKISSQQSHKTIRIHFYRLTIFILNEILHEFQRGLQSLPSMLSRWLILWNCLEERMVDSINVNRVEHNKRKVWDVFLDHFWLVCAYLNKSKLNRGSQYLILLVMKSSQFQKKGKLWLFYIEEDVDLLFVIVNFADE